MAGRGGKAGLKARSRVGQSLDGVIREISPTWAHRRQRSRAMLAVGDGYDVARSSRHRRQRGYAGGSADKHLSARTLFQIREICRDADRNSPLLHGIIERWVDNVVGPTFQFHPTTADEGWNNAAQEYIEGRMGKTADLRRKNNFRRLVRLWLRSLAPDGDILIAFTDDGLASYEADQLASPWGRAAVAGNRSIINGVHVDKNTGRDLGYHVAKRSYKGFVAGDYEKETTYIPAREAIFPANYHRISATRGVPILASAMKVFDHLDSYLTSELTAADVTADLTWFIKRADPSFWTDENGNLPAWVKEETAADGTAQQLRKSEPGMIITGDVGDELEMFDPKRPGESFEPFVITAMRMIGCGIGMPLELVLLDFSRTNYSSARASLLQAYRTFGVWQEFVIDEMLGPVYSRWIGQAIVEGDLTLREDAFKVEWLMPKWAWIDPLKEVLAAEKAVSLGVDTLTEYIERERQTLGQYIKRRKRELVEFSRSGIPSTGGALIDTDGQDEDREGFDDE